MCLSTTPNHRNNMKGRTKTATTILRASSNFHDSAEKIKTNLALHVNVSTATQVFRKAKHPKNEKLTSDDAASMLPLMQGCRFGYFKVFS